MWVVWWLRQLRMLFVSRRLVLGWMRIGVVRCGGFEGWVWGIWSGGQRVRCDCIVIGFRGVWELVPVGCWW